jgi:hypothetical protein
MNIYVKYLPWIILRMRNVAEKSCGENQNKYFMFKNVFLSKIAPFMRYVEKVGRDRLATDYNITQCLWFAYRIIKAIDISS